MDLIPAQLLLLLLFAQVLHVEIIISTTAPEESSHSIMITKPRVQVSLLTSFFFQIKHHSTQSPPTATSHCPGLLTTCC